jgi:predicted ribosome quality control (RQC) complex YloA/Tae2 family protein
MENAALLAAWFSFARQSGKAAVDYTLVSKVKKIPKGGPGLVSFTNQKTIFVNPQNAKELIKIANETGN